MGSVSAVFLDVGGVLVAHDNAFLFEQIGSHCSVGTDPHALASLVIDSGLRTGRPLDEFHADLRVRFGYRGAFEEFVYTWSTHFSSIAATQSCLHTLRAEYRLFVLSNTNAEHWRAISERYLDTSLFEELLLSHELGLCKPDPRIFELALRRTGLRAAECVFVDDSPENVSAAAACGFRATLYRQPEDLRAVVLAAATVGPTPLKSK